MKPLLLLLLQLLLAPSLLCADVPPAAAEDVNQQLLLLRQISIGGCPVMVRGHPLTSIKAAGAGKMRLSLDPLLCVDAANLTAAAAAGPRYDPVARQTYVSIPVKLTDAAVPDEVKIKLRRILFLSSSDVDFAAVTRVEVTTDPGSVYSEVGFVWSQGESVGYLRLGCSSLAAAAAGDAGGRAACRIDGLLDNLRKSNYAALDRVLLSVTLSGGEPAADYRLTVVAAASTDSPLLDYSVSSRDARSRRLPACSQHQLQPVRAIRLGNCTAMAYRQPGGKGAYLVEQPICYRGGGGAEVSTAPDHSRNKHSLKLPLQGSDEKEAREQLADLDPKSVKLMSVWRARHVVSASLAGRYEVGPLRAPSGGSGGMGELRLHCRHVASCGYLRSQINANPVDFWRHIEWRVTYLMPSADANDVDGFGGICAHTPAAGRYSTRMEDASGAMAARAAAVASPRASEMASWREACPTNRGAHCQYLEDGHFIVVQQRKTGTERFDRPWENYVAGFGDANDFWIGLTALHVLTGQGATLRLELDLWNGSKFVSEYAGFQVGDASSNYRMTYRERTSTNVAFDAMATHNGMPFTTYDRDHDNDDGSCSLTWGRGGWWFNKCYKLYVNGLFPTTNIKDWKYNMWASDTEVVPLRYTRMMLQM